MYVLLIYAFESKTLCRSWVISVRICIYSKTFRILYALCTYLKICIRTYVYICIDVCIMYVCMYVCMSKGIQGHLSTYMYTFTHTYKHTQTNMKIHK